MDKIGRIWSMKTYRIKQVSKITGLSKEVLRVWEKRYRLVSPERGPNRYRIYSEEDVNLLIYLAQETQKGQTIGDLAILGREELIRRMNQETTVEPSVEIPVTDSLIKDLEATLVPLDRISFEKKLNEIFSLLPFADVFQRVLVPLQIRVGELWFEGKLSIATEHYVTAQVKQKLFAVMNMMSNEKGPKVVLACPPWELHEIGSQMVAFHATSVGCQSIFLGANLPTEDLIQFCQSTQPEVVILSFTAPVSDSNGRIYLAEISKNLVPICDVWIGGQAIKNLIAFIDNKKIKPIKNFQELDARLNELFQSTS